MRTLLRYPGGKSRAVKYIKPYFPKDISTVCSPFFGGGAIELSLGNEGIKVYGYDSFEPLTEFWQAVITSPNELADEVSKYFPISKETFYELQKNQQKLPSLLKRAAAFYVLNRSSFSGTTLSGGMSPGHPRFTERSIQRLRDFNAKNIEVVRMDFKESIPKHSEDFLYCDPPYYIESKLYGKKGSTHKGFDHEGLSNLLRERSGWILSYNDCEYVRELYSGYIFETPSWKYGMNSSKKSNEVLIINY